MNFFPILNSGAISQYPTESSAGRGVGIIRFVDSSDQRFLISARRLRRWRVNLALLSDGEIVALEVFYRAQKGTFSTFTFTDPATNTQIPNCRFGNSELDTDYVGWDKSTTSFWIMETNG